MFKTIFIGNESPFLETINRYSALSLIVCEQIKGKFKKIFGSAFDYAKQHKIKVVSPEVFFDNPEPADIAIVFGYHKLIPKKIISHPRIGIINIHQSLLPLYRGRHPLNWAIINGEKYTGVTIHHINDKFDEGKTILQAKVKIEDEDTIMDVYSKTVEKAKELIKKLFKIVGKKEFEGFPQDERFATRYHPRRPRDGKIDWRDSAANIKNLVRALAYPYPGAYFYLNGAKIIVDKAKIIRKDFPKIETDKPCIYDGSIFVKTGKGYLKIVKIRNK